MNILYLAHRIPYPPNKGDKIRSFHQIRSLAKDHNVYLACLVDDRADLKYVARLRKYCRVVEAVYRPAVATWWQVGLSIAGRQSLSVAAFYSRELQRKINDILNIAEIDCILVFSSPMAEYVRNVTHVPKVMDFVDVDSEKWRAYADVRPFPISLVYGFEAGKLARYEEDVAKSFSHSVFVSEREVQLFQKRVPDRPVSMIPNGVDLEFFNRGDGPVGASVGPVIVFSGAMDYYPNIDAVGYFCRDIFPLIREVVPEAQFKIVGRKPSPFVKKLGRYTNVTVTGTVQDVRPFLAQSAVSVAPLRIARGIQNKVLEAMAMGVPVVGTSDAFQGLSATEKDGVRIVDDPGEFARTVIRWLNDSSLRRTCSVLAREYVQRHHQWDVLGARLVALLRGAA